jgi:hypothetical protein
MVHLNGLPGADLVEAGLADLRAGTETEPALLVRIAAPRLRAVGIEVPHTASGEASPEHELYSLIAARGERGAHSRYNALLARIASFAAAAEHATAG